MREFHFFELVSRTPGIRVDDLIALFVIADDQAHMAATRLGDAALLDDAYLQSPEQGNAFINLIAHILGETVIGGSLGAH